MKLTSFVRRHWLAGAVAVVGLGGLAYAQGVQVLTTLLATYQVPIVTPGAVNTVSSLQTLKNFINSAPAGLTLSPRLVHSGAVPAITSASGTDTTPVITQVYISEIFIGDNMTVTGVSVLNGTVASGNLKVGLANSAGAVVATSVSTAMAGTAVYQRVSFSTPYAAVGPGTYYVLLFTDNITARTRTHVFGDWGTAVQTGQTYATGFTTITPPTTFTTGVGPIASLF